jgi:hypothetical protein
MRRERKGANAQKNNGIKDIFSSGGGHMMETSTFSLKNNPVSRKRKEGNAPRIILSRWCLVALFFALLFVLMGAAPLFSADTLWELVPEDDPSFSPGKIKIIGGLTHPEGVRFIIKNLSLNQPIQITIVSRDEKSDITLRVFKDNWDNPLLMGSTMGAGEVTFRFRTGDHAAFTVSGPEGEPYQLFAWVGHGMELPPPPVFMTMSDYESKGEGPLPLAGTGDNAERPRNTFLIIILAAILVVLVVIAVLLFLGLKKKLALSPFLLLIVCVAVVALPPVSSGMFYEEKPTRLESDEVWERTNNALHTLREKLDSLPETGVDSVDDTVGATKLLIAFLEQFGFIDPREAAVRPDYTPAGLPPLPSRCYEDPQNRCGDCFVEPSENLEKWRRLLEKQWVIYKETELEAGRIIELADAAAGLSPYAQLYWTVTKLDIQNEAAAEFYAEYDKNYTELMKRLNDALIAIGDCERTYFGDEDWYNQYGMPYYLFMRDRYLRK